MITNIEIEKLYNRFNYSIKLGYRDVTILTGPNGYGKTTILKIINYISKGDLEKLNDILFESIKILCDNSNEFIIKRLRGSLFINDIKVDILYNKKKAITDKDFIDIYKNKSMNNYILNNIYIDSKKTIDITIEDGIKFIEEHNSAVTILNKLKKSVGNVYFIREQRLLKVETKKVNLSSLNNLKKNNKSIVNIINDLPKKFQQLISEVSNNYSQLSNSLDSTYPHRLFNTENGITEKEYQKKIQEMKFRFEKLMKYDLLKEQYIPNVKFDEQHSKALKVYFDDFDKKYEIYEDFINKMDLFIKIINKKLKFKEIKIDRKKGIEVIEVEESHKSKKRNIELNDLSSGEKQEILLFFDLIFNTKENIILLIDEPEISLHVAWQRQFMDDLASISKYMKLTSIVATHSPQIIGSYWEKQIDLGELYERI